MNDQLIASQGWKYEVAEEKAFALERLLRRFEISIAPGTAFESAVINAMEVAEEGRSRPVALESADVRTRYRQLVGVHELATLILAVEGHDSFSSLVPHLRLLNQGAALQNVPSPGRDSATNKLFELMMATIVMSLGTDVVLDHPIRSDGSNPDVLATLGGRRWGFACKVLHSTHPEGFLTHVRKGVEQIEASEAELGVVVVNLKNVMDHDLIWPLSPPVANKLSYPAAWRSEEGAFEALRAQTADIGRRLHEHVPDAQAALRQQFQGAEKAVPAVILWAHSVAGVMVANRPTPTSMRLVHAITCGREIPDADAIVLQDLHWAAMPDSPRRGPRPSSVTP